MSSFVNLLFSSFSYPLSLPVSAATKFEEAEEETMTEGAGVCMLL